MFHNVVIGKPIVDIETLLATDKKDWEENEKEKKHLQLSNIVIYRGDSNWG